MTRPQYVGCVAIALTARTAVAWPPPASDPRVFEAFEQLSTLAGESDWEAEYPNIERAIKNIWQRNGWTGEADAYARDLALELAAIPPWEPLKRINLLGDRVALRYGLEETQALRVKSLVLREIARVLSRHAATVIQQVSEGMRFRASGRPFTSEQVADWSKSMEPLLTDLHQGIDRVREELAVMVPPERRAILDQDVASYQKRRAFMDEMGQRWAAGKWRPEDWGLQDDPIQAASHSAARLGAAARPGAGTQEPARGTPASALPKWLAYEPTTWLSYVIEFRGKYGLDRGQITTADSIHSELLSRAMSYVEDHASELQAVPAEARPDHDAYKPIIELFEQLQKRLDAIPTSAQRQRAEQ